MVRCILLFRIVFSLMVCYFVLYSYTSAVYLQKNTEIQCIMIENVLVDKSMFILYF